MVLSWHVVKRLATGKVGINEGVTSHSSPLSDESDEYLSLSEEGQQRMEHVYVLGWREHFFVDVVGKFNRRGKRRFILAGAVSFKYVSHHCELQAMEAPDIVAV